MAMPALALEAPLRALLDAFRENCCPKEWQLLPFGLASEPPELKLTVRDDTFAPRLVTGRFSGFMLLAGRYFGATFDDRSFALQPVYLPTLDARELEKRLREPLIDAGLELATMGEEEEAVFLLRRALLGSGYDGFAGIEWMGRIPDRIPSSLRAEVARPARVVAELQRRARWQVTRALEVAVAAFDDRDPLERAVAATAAEDIIAAGSNSGPAMAEVALEPLVVLAADPNGFIEERALAALERLGALLFQDGALDPLTRCIGPLLAKGVGIATQLRRRWACRVMAGDSAGAESDRQQLEALVSDPAGREKLFRFFVEEQQAIESGTRRADRPTQRRRAERPPEPIVPAVPGQFLDALLESLREDLVQPATTGPRSGETCESLRISVFGDPGTSPLYAFQGPSFVLRRSGDAAAAVELYRRLAQAWKRGARTRAMKALVDEVAALVGETSRYAWFELRELMESAEGARDRQQLEEALARRSRSEPPCDVPTFLGTRVFRAEPERAARLVDLFQRALGTGRGPALGEAVLRELPERLRAAGALDALPRARGFTVTVGFGHARARDETVVAYP